MNRVMWVLPLALLATLYGYMGLWQPFAIMSLWTLLATLIGIGDMIESYLKPKDGPCDSPPSP